MCLYAAMYLVLDSLLRYITMPGGYPAVFIVLCRITVLLLSDH